LNKTNWPFKFVLVNNAATSRSIPLLEVKQEQLEYEFAVNVFGVIYMTQAVVGVGRMPKGGRIINIGSIASKILVPPPVYGATKAAMDALTTLWAGEVSFLWCSSFLYARQPSNEMPDSLVRAVELLSIHSHPVQFQQICRKSFWWPLTGLQLRFSFLCMNRRELRIVLGQWTMWLMLRFC
jgi:short chain dehydrogenase